MRVSTYEFVGDTNIRSITNRFSLTSLSNGGPIAQVSDLTHRTIEYMFQVMPVEFVICCYFHFRVLWFG